MPSSPVLLFPRWIEASGLPAAMLEATKTPHAYWVFRKVVELDMDRNRAAPGLVEVSLHDLGALTGLRPDQVEKAAKKLRAAKNRPGWLRCFLPDSVEEEGLFQVLVPLATPTTWQDVREAHADLRDLPDDAFRYAHTDATGVVDVTAAGADGFDPKTVADPALREVLNLYFDHVSMKMNAFILDELRLIASRFDLELVRRVFARAEKKEIQGLGWILAEIRRERGRPDPAKATTGADVG